MALTFGASGVTVSNRGQQSFRYGLQAGEVALIPAGTWGIRPGIYCTLQEYNPIITCWENVAGSGTRDWFWMDSDGVNFRIANQSGCVIGAVVTTAGSGYTQATAACTAASGGAKFQPIIGGAISTTITVVKGGSNYVYPPQVQIAAPPAPGIPATAYCTLSGAAVSTVTVVTQGAGYQTAPPVVLVNDPRDTAGYGATATTALTGSGTVTGLLVTDHGTPLTSVPVLTITGGTSGAATAVMAFAVTSFGLTTAGAGYTASAGTVIAAAVPVPVSGSAILNDQYQSGLVKLRACQVAMTTSAGGAITTTQNVIDGGCYPAVPGVQAIQIAAATAIVTTAAVLTVAVGGQNDNYLLLGV